MCASRRTRVYHTLAEAKIKYSKYVPAAAYNLVRARARSVIARLGIKACQTCGYDRHVEVAHKKPIGSFPPETPIDEINAPENLLVLCPNCHWEFDHPIVAA